jgi:hypothetical protein
MAKSMNGQSSLFDPTTCEGLFSATSSPALGAGASPFDSLAGVTTGPSGPAVAPVSRSRALAPKLAAPMRATFGQRGFSSSRSAAFQSSLASRLRARLHTDGSTVFAMTWKEKTTPSGRLVFLLRASARSIFGRGSGSWPTPVVNDATGSQYSYSSGNHDRPALKLPGAAALAHWTTPNANEQDEAPEVKDARNARHRAMGKMKGVGSYKLSTQAQLATWATPTALDTKGAPSRPYSERGGGKKGQRLDSQVVHSGPALNGSTAETAKRGQLNPAHSRWLMGYPPAWDDCAVTAMPSSRKSPRRS